MGICSLCVMALLNTLHKMTMADSSGLSRLHTFSFSENILCLKVYDGFTAHCVLGEAKISDSCRTSQKVDALSYMLRGSNGL